MAAIGEFDIDWIALKDSEWKVDPGATVRSVAPLGSILLAEGFCEALGKAPVRTWFYVEREAGMVFVPEWIGKLASSDTKFSKWHFRIVGVVPGTGR